MSFVTDSTPMTAPAAEARSAVATAGAPGTTSSTPTTRRTAYVVKVYPRFSETFVVTEILAREARGEDLEIFALRPTTDTRFHPELARVKAPVTFIGRSPKLSEGWALHQRAVAEIPGFAARYGAMVDQVVADDWSDVHQALELALECQARGITHLHAHFANAAGRATELAARFLGIPYSVTSHAKDLFHTDVDPERLRRLVAGSHHLVTISDYNRRFLTGSFPEAAHKVVLQYNGLELSRFPYREPAAPGTGTLRVVAVGRLVEKKGFGELLTAAGRLRAAGPDLQVEIAGDGDLRADLQARIDAEGLADTVRLLGARTQEEIRALLAASDVFVAPCVVGADGNADGLPTVLLEAMATGVPVIASAVTGIPEVVEDGVTGILHAPGDTAALEAGLRSFAEGTVDGRVFARNARALIEERFDSHRQAAALAALEDGPALEPGTAPEPAATHPDTVPSPPTHPDLRGRSVAYVSVDPGIPAFGTKGASVHVQEVVRELRARGARVTLYVTRTDAEVPADLADVPVVHVPVDRKDADGRRLDDAAREAAQVAASAEIAARIVAAGHTLVYERYSLFSTVLDRVAAAGIPGVLEVNAPLIDEQATHRVLVDEAGACAALRAQVQAAARTVTVSRPVADWVTGQVPGADPVVAPNGVNTERIRPGADTTDPTAAPRVVFVGTLKPWHGVDVLIEALALAREPWDLRIVGDGPMSEQIRARVAELGDAVAARVEFTGSVAPAEVPALLSDCTVAVAPYPAVAATDSYFSPLKVYEYLAAGLPVVASAIGQIPAVFEGTELEGTEHGRPAVEMTQAGRLVGPSDAAALAAALDDLARDPGTRVAMAREARHLAETRHSWATTLDRTLAGVVL
ncbi:glycosyltransferase [Brevibacterium litoralis]|uniref:glycosyltransferase n=1 Tax=Brevibacterium litoralis TaxID=3138935 RepID=UPI0032EAE79F